MDAQRFDALTRALAATSSRRSALRLLAGGFAAAAISQTQETDAAAQQGPCGCCGDDCAIDADCASNLCLHGRCSNGLGQQPFGDGNRLSGEACTSGADCCSGGCQSTGGPAGVCRSCDSPDDPLFCPGSGCCKPKKFKITSLKLNDIDNTPLQYLSAADHPYFGGKTRINGTIAIVGDRNDRLESLALEVVQNGVAIATATLAAGVSSALLTSFGRHEKIALTRSRLLFELPTPGSQGVDGARNGTLILRAKARSRDEGETTKEYGPVELLVRYAGANRYGGRDANVGGDDWVKPSVNAVLNHYAGIDWGDMSNMNGGKFPGHVGHRNGQEADGFFVGYNARDATTAAAIIGHLNDPDFGSRITKVLVTYSLRPCDAFCKAIKEVTLDDGRDAAAVIRPAPKHDTHFHWYVAP